MLKQLSLTARFSWALCGIFFWPASPLYAQPLLALVSNKSNYISGEPILLQFTMGCGDKPFQLKSYGIWWREGGFTLEIARTDRAFLSVLAMNFRKTFFIAIPRAGRDDFTDRYILPSSLQPGEQVKRVEMLVLKPDKYWVKAVLCERDGTRYESNEVNFEVKPVEGNDSVAVLGDSDFSWRLGNRVFAIHYQQNTDSITMSENQFHEVSKKVFNKYKRSLFYPYILYGASYHTLVHDIYSQPRPSAVEIDTAISNAQKFIAEYSDSWLVSELRAALFQYYLRSNQKAAAIEIGNAAIQADPSNVMLQNSGLLKQLKELQQAEPPTAVIKGEKK